MTLPLECGIIFASNLKLWIISEESPLRFPRRQWAGGRSIANLHKPFLRKRAEMQLVGVAADLQPCGMLLWSGLRSQLV